MIGLRPNPREESAPAGPICPACEAGNHEEPAWTSLMKCICYCHIASPDGRPADELPERDYYEGDSPDY